MKRTLARLRAAFRIPTATELGLSDADVTSRLDAQCRSRAAHPAGHRRARLPEGYRYRAIPADLFVEVENRGAALAAPLADTGLLADAICDGDHPALRESVTVYPTGAMVHGGVL